ncbi:hypothetical protein [Paenibacillus macerans]|uniref:MerR HTH regulatory family protein n=1 Tax=Paenibacillus macerans TaxID=44252 RepID=A0A090Y400_PAEMA|nr:hypothetical protein [Paenibacillus macerans]KFM92951.1 hypothetical protein DJ90_2943 [Paenibacillus macerans]MCY7558557.1 hypothetical protein [Paenibacillus macerans]MEC0153935.1 hypothetical protein [Paenibacillus macerans]SUA84793.1 Uncharacterised protein [Paenibacillus macerans]GIP08842.1 hypothetical protein J1TS5_10120 [Paenibacillus macerans]
MNEVSFHEVLFKEAAQWLETAESTLRRWVYLLEEKGYEFNRGGKRRQLNIQDFGVLREVKLLSQKMTVEQACQQICDELNSLRQVESSRPTERSEAFANLDRLIRDFRERLFWQGQNAVVQELSVRWQEYKNQTKETNE